MRLINLFISLFFVLPMSFAQQHLPAYQLFDKEGKPADFENMLSTLNEADVVLFGELHNNPICHWLQLQVTKKLHEQKGENLVLAAEMFEADDQIIIDEFFAGKIKESHLENEAKIWNNYATDYRPLLLFAKENKLTFVASNIPRRYASLVSREGLDALKDLEKEAKNWIAPLPIEVDLELPGYKNMLAMMGAHGGGDNSKANNFAYAQAVKDATMAYFILENLKKDQQVLHYNGAYHSNNFEGIYWYLKQKKSKLKIVTISSVEEGDVSGLDEKNIGLADFVIAIPSDMTKTY